MHVLTITRSCKTPCCKGVTHGKSSGKQFRRISGEVWYWIKWQHKYSKLIKTIDHEEADILLLHSSTLVKETIHVYVQYADALLLLQHFSLNLKRHMQYYVFTHLHGMTPVNNSQKWCFKLFMSFHDRVLYALATLGDGKLLPDEPDEL